jgi:hypothetical protein
LLDKLSSYQQQTKLFHGEDRSSAPFKIKVNNNIYDKPKDAGAALFDNLKKIYNKAYNDFYLNRNDNASNQFYPVGSIDRCRIEIRFANFNHQKVDDYVISSTSFRLFNPELGVQVGHSKNVSAGEAPFATQVLNTFYYLPAQIDKVKENITALEQDLKTQQEIIKIPVQNFDEEIHQLKKRLNEVNEIILSKVSERNQSGVDDIKEQDISMDDDDEENEQNYSEEQDEDEEYDNNPGDDENEQDCSEQSEEAIAIEEKNDFVMRFRR